MSQRHLSSGQFRGHETKMTYHDVSKATGATFTDLSIDHPARRGHKEKGYKY